jgi:cobalt-zinc-cadmium efflux system protein
VAAINGTALLVVTLLVVLEAVRRLLHGTPQIHGLPVLVVSAVTTAVMVLGVLVLGREAGQEDLHMRSVLIDTVSDALTSAAVAVGGLIIFLKQGMYWLDSALAIVIGLVVGVTAVRLLRDVARALRTGAALELDD